MSSSSSCSGEGDYPMQSSPASVLRSSPEKVTSSSQCLNYRLSKLSFFLMIIQDPKTTHCQVEPADIISLVDLYAPIKAQNGL